MTDPSKDRPRPVLHKFIESGAGPLWPDLILFLLAIIAAFAWIWWE